MRKTRVGDIYIEPSTQQLWRVESMTGGRIHLVDSYETREPLDFSPRVMQTGIREGLFRFAWSSEEVWCNG